MVQRRKIVLTDEVKLPAKTARDVQAACNPRIDLVGQDLLVLREDLSKVRGGDRIARMEACVRGAIAGDYQVQLFSGHSGSGKSTELRWLATQLQKSNEGRIFHVVFIDIEDYLNERDIQIPEFLTAIVSALLDDPAVGPTLQASTTAERIWKDVRTWLKQLGVTLEAEIPLGIAKMKLSFKTSPGLQERYRDENRKHVTALIESLSDLVQEARTYLAQQGVDDLVILVDKLDRIERLPLNDNTGRTRHDLFYLEQLPYIQDVPAHFIVTVPVTLHFTQDRLRQVFHGVGNVVLPMVAVRKRGTDTPDEAGIAAMRSLLARRIDLDVVFANEDAVRDAIVQSGGSIRDLFRLVTLGVLNKPKLGLSREDVDIVVKEMASNVERLLQGRGFLKELHHIAKTGSFPESFKDDVKQWLLYQLVVLEYNGETWYDVHPFAKRTRAFRDALQPPPQ